MYLGEDKLKECKIVFDMFDKDKDGKITTNELGDVMRILGAAPSQDKLENIIQELENSENSFVSFEKFLALFKKQLETQDDEEDIIMEFRKLDRNGNGKITENDLRSLMSNYDNALSSEDVEEIISSADIDEDGYIDYVNFTKMLFGKI